MYQNITAQFSLGVGVMADYYVLTSFSLFALSKLSMVRLSYSLLGMIHLILNPSDQARIVGKEKK